MMKHKRHNKESRNQHFANFQYNEKIELQCDCLLCDRVIITTGVVNSTSDSPILAALYDPTADTCSGDACDMERAKNIEAVSASEEPWKILNVSALA